MADVDRARLGAALPAAEIRALLHAEPPLATDLADPDLQVQPNGLDLRLDSIWSPVGAGRLGRAERELPARRAVRFDDRDWVHLPAGAYVAQLSETLNLPVDLMALGYTRSSLLRGGTALLNAVWDAGYRGRSEVLLTVFNPAGVELQRGARILQLVFFRLTAPTEAYRGAYQGENSLDRTLPGG
jgi:dUTP pyrophosphatase